MNSNWFLEDLYACDRYRTIDQIYLIVLSTLCPTSGAQCGLQQRGFLPVICDITRPEDAITALDLAPENVRRAEEMMDKVAARPRFSAHIPHHAAYGETIQLGATGNDGDSAKTCPAGRTAHRLMISISPGNATNRHFKPTLSELSAVEDKPVYFAFE